MLASKMILIQVRQSLQTQIAPNNNTFATKTKGSDVDYNPCHENNWLKDVQPEEFLINQ